MPAACGVSETGFAYLLGNDLENLLEEVRQNGVLIRMVLALKLPQRRPVPLETRAKTHRDQKGARER